MIKLYFSFVLFSFINLKAETIQVNWIDLRNDEKFVCYGEHYSPSFGYLCNLAKANEYYLAWCFYKCESDISDESNLEHMIVTFDIIKDESEFRIIFSDNRVEQHTKPENFINPVKTRHIKFRNSVLRIRCREFRTEINSSIRFDGYHKIVREQLFKKVGISEKLAENYIIDNSLFIMKSSFFIQESDNEELGLMLVLVPHNLIQKDTDLDR